MDAARAEAAAELEAARKARASLAGIEKALEERETYLVESWRRRRERERDDPGGLVGLLEDASGGEAAAAAAAFSLEDVASHATPGSAKPHVWIPQTPTTPTTPQTRGGGGGGLGLGLGLGLGGVASAPSTPASVVVGGDGLALTTNSTDVDAANALLAEAIRRETALQRWQSSVEREAARVRAETRALASSVAAHGETKAADARTIEDARIAATNALRDATEKSSAVDAARFDLESQKEKLSRLVAALGSRESDVARREDALATREAAERETRDELARTTATATATAEAAVRELRRLEGDVETRRADL